MPPSSSQQNLTDPDFLATCLDLAVTPRFAMPCADLLQMMQLAGVEDTAPYHWVVLEERETGEVEAVGVRELVERARAGE